MTENERIRAAEYAQLRSNPRLAEVFDELERSTVESLAAINPSSSTVQDLVMTLQALRALKSQIDYMCHTRSADKVL